MVECFIPGWVRSKSGVPRWCHPLFGDLRGMPPALFTVGTADHLADDTYLMASRSTAAGADVLIYPEAPHGCIGLPSVFGHWIIEVERFLDARLDGHRILAGTAGAPT